MLKKLLTGIFALVCSAAFAVEYVDPYRVMSNAPDSSLKKTEAVFALQFFNPYLGIEKHPIRMSCNNTEQTVQPDEKGEVRLTLLPGSYVLRFFCSQEFYEITTDSIRLLPGYRAEVDVHFHFADQNIKPAKPVIYLYPKQTMPVSVTLKLDGAFGFTYPAYKDGWKVVADPDGTLHANDKTYNYLFWDGNMNVHYSDINSREGFIVTRDSLVSFFERSLTTMGLQANEIEDYITYWVPLMSTTDRNYIHFIFNEDYNKHAALTITPAPDKLFRVLMAWAPISDKAKVAPVIPQQLQSFRREGFTVVEWGGAKIPPVTFSEHSSK